MSGQKNHSEIFKIDGVGVNLSRFHPCTSEEKNALRAELGYSEKDFILIYVAEFISRKNHKLIFNVLSDLKRNIPELKLIFCGKGKLFKFYKDYCIQNGLNFVFLAGYTKKVDLYYKISDVCVSTSIQEGQGLNLVESMACGLPVVASFIRGHSDVINNGWNGILYNLKNPSGFINAIILLYKNPSLRDEMGRRNVCEAKKYSVDIAVGKMAAIYSEVISENVGGGGNNCRVVLQFCLPSYSKLEAA